MSLTESNKGWMLTGAVRDHQSITKDWQPAEESLIDGVVVMEVKNVPIHRGHLTEIYRTDWGLEPSVVAQVFQSFFDPNAISAWHAHEVTTDRLFVSMGQMLIVLYDARAGSPTRGQLNQFRFGMVRPALVTVPPCVWHGVQNICSSRSLLLNLVDRAYNYESPDHYRLPLDTEQIPFQFMPPRRDALRDPPSSS